MYNTENNDIPTTSEKVINSNNDVTPPTDIASNVLEVPYHVNCNICFDNILNTEAFLCLYCEGKYCSTCIVENEIFSCLEPNCNEPFEDRLVKKFFSLKKNKTHNQKYIDNLIFNLVKNDITDKQKLDAIRIFKENQILLKHGVQINNATICLNDKNQFVLKNDNSQLTKDYVGICECNNFIIRSNDLMKCQVCDNNLCNYCEKTYKNGSEHTCLDDDIKTLKFYKENDAKKCPNCFTYIIKSEGCNDMICISCGCKFLWRTMQITTKTSNHHYDSIVNNKTLVQGIRNLTNNIREENEIRTENRHCNLILVNTTDPVSDVFVLYIFKERSKVKKDYYKNRIDYIFKQTPETKNKLFYSFKKLIYLEQLWEGMRKLEKGECDILHFSEINKQICDNGIFDKRYLISYCEEHPKKLITSREYNSFLKTHNIKVEAKTKTPVEPLTLRRSHRKKNENSTLSYIDDEDFENKDQVPKVEGKPYSSLLTIRPSTSSKKDKKEIVLLSAEQEDHYLTIKNILIEHHCALDSSYTGSGKSYTSLKAFKDIGVDKILILCPLTVYEKWCDIIKTYNDYNNFEVIIIPYSKLNPLSSLKNKYFIKEFDFIIKANIFTLTPEFKSFFDAEKVGMIIDETHHVRNSSSIISNLIKIICKGARPRLNIKNYIINISATPIDKNEQRLSLFNKVQFVDLKNPRERLEIFFKRLSFDTVTYSLPTREMHFIKYSSHPPEYALNYMKINPQRIGEIKYQNIREFIDIVMNDPEKLASLDISKIIKFKKAYNMNFQAVEIKHPTFELYITKKFIDSPRIPRPEVLFICFKKENKIDSLTELTKTMKLIARYNDKNLSPEEMFALAVKFECGDITYMMNELTTKLNRQVAYSVKSENISTKFNYQLRLKLNEDDNKILEHAFSRIDVNSGAEMKVSSIIAKAIPQIETAVSNSLIEIINRLLIETSNTKIVISCNSIHTIDLILKGLNHNYKNKVLCISNKHSTNKERYEIIKAFNENTNAKRLLLATQSSISEGIDLDDKTGDFRRIVFIIPNFTLIDIIQTKGRFERIDSKSIPYIYLISNGRAIINNLMEKCNTLKDLNENLVTIKDFEVIEDVNGTTDWHFDYLIRKQNVISNIEADKEYLTINKEIKSSDDNNNIKDAITSNDNNVEEVSTSNKRIGSSESSDESLSFNLREVEIKNCKAIFGLNDNFPIDDEESDNDKVIGLTDLIASLSPRP